MIIKILFLASLAHAGGGHVSLPRNNLGGTFTANSSTIATNGTLSISTAPNSTAFTKPALFIDQNGNTEIRSLKISNVTPNLGFTELDGVTDDMSIRFVTGAGGGLKVRNQLSSVDTVQFPQLGGMIIGTGNTVSTFTATGELHLEIETSDDGLDIRNRSTGNLLVTARRDGGNDRGALALYNAGNVGVIIRATGTVSFQGGQVNFGEVTTRSSTFTSTGFFLPRTMLAADVGAYFPQAREVGGYISCINCTVPYTLCVATNTLRGAFQKVGFTVALGECK